MRACTDGQVNLCGRCIHPSDPQPITPKQELEAERQALTARQAELQAKLSEGATLSKEESEALAELEAQLAALREKEAALPQEVRTWLGDGVRCWGRFEFSPIPYANALIAVHTQQLEAARAREAELSGLLKGKKEELKALTAQQGEYINDLTRGVVMYKHLGLDFEREFGFGVYVSCGYSGGFMPPLSCTTTAA